MCQMIRGKGVGDGDDGAFFGGGVAVAAEAPHQPVVAGFEPPIGAHRGPGAFGASTHRQPVTATISHHRLRRPKTSPRPRTRKPGAVFAGGGRSRVRTWVGLADGFTDRSLWPLVQPASCRHTILHRKR